MRNVFLRLRYLNTWSSVEYAISEVVELFGGEALSEDVWFGLGEVIASPLFLIFSLMHEVEDRMSQLPAPMTCCCAFPAILLLEPKTHITVLPEVASGHSVLPQHRNCNCCIISTLCVKGLRDELIKLWCQDTMHLLK